jgi:hypothetical protein
LSVLFIAMDCFGDFSVSKRVPLALPQ